MDGIVGLELGPGASAPRVDEHIEARGVLPDAIWKDTQSFGARHRREVIGNGEHGHAVVRPLARPEGEDLPGPGEVQFLGVREERDADVHAPNDGDGASAGAAGPGEKRSPRQHIRVVWARMFVLPSCPERGDDARAGALVEADLLIASDPIKGPR